jgi:hypothetical protein
MTAAASTEPRRSTGEEDGITTMEARFVFLRVRHEEEQGDGRNTVSLS